MTLVTSNAGAPEARSRSRLRFEIGRNSSRDRASDDMLRLYRTNLEVRLQSFDEEALSEHQKQIRTKITEMLRAPVYARETDSGLEWDDTYKLERLSALLYSGAQLRQETSRRIAELQDQKIPGSDVLQREYEALTRHVARAKVAPVDDGVLRAFLLRLIEAHQWAAKKEYLARPVRKAATKKVILGVFITFLLLVVPYLLLSADFRQTRPLNPLWTHLALYTALISGALGAFFSRLMLLQRDWSKMTLEEVCLHNEWSYTLLRASVGMCGALIMFYFFVSGLIDGSIFPHVAKFAINLTVVEPPGLHMAFATPSRDFALLTVWCFLAGFSELLVPGLLAKTERQLGQVGTASNAMQGR